MVSRVEKLRNIVVGADLQAVSKRTLARAADIARRADASLHLVHVCPEADNETPGALTRHAEMLDEARRALGIVRARLLDDQVKVGSSECFGSGRPEDRLLERAGEVSADLVVVGSTAREGHGHRLGSTADRVVRSGAFPVLVVRGDTTTAVRRVAILIDFSEASLVAARRARTWLPALLSAESASPGDGTLQVDFVHAGDERVLAMDSSVDAWSRQRLDEEVAGLKAGIAAGVEVRQRVIWGTHPVDRIEAAVAEHDWQLLIAGTRGKGPLTRWVVGSVALGLCQGAPCPVLVIPSP